MTNPLSVESQRWGVVYEPAIVNPGQGWWRCLSVKGPYKWDDKHSTFADVLDAYGQRIVGLRLRWFNGGNSFKPTEPKTGEPFSIDFPMYAQGNAYGLQVADGQPSDLVFGFGLGDRQPHQVFAVIFQYVREGQTELPPVDPPDAAGVLIDEAIRLLQRARGML